MGLALKGSGALPKVSQVLDQNLEDFMNSISLGIQSPSENGFMEPKCLAFRRWLYTPIIIWRSVSQDP